ASGVLLAPLLQDCETGVHITLPGPKWRFDEDFLIDQGLEPIFFGKRVEKPAKHAADQHFTDQNLSPILHSLMFHYKLITLDYWHIFLPSIFRQHGQRAIST